MRFVEHIIADGDTIQQISQHYTLDMNNWTEIASFNNLRYPYIVYTVAEKNANPNHLVTIGDTIMVKVTEDREAKLIQETKKAPEFNQDEVFALTLGKDLAIIPERNTKIGSPGWDIDSVALAGDSKGRLATKSGIENLKQSLFLRLITPRGSYLGHPNFGSKLDMYLGTKLTEEQATLIDLEIERTIRTDGRVKTVKILHREVSGRDYLANVLVTSYTLEESFEMLMASRDGTPFILVDNFKDFQD
ncbi:baseplate assembly protein [Bacillus phage vB_BceH_LY2]|nr:baseplate assembly protein [Bacillus phage vB_BceH_LY2]